MSTKPQIRVSIVIVVFLCSPALAAAQDVSPTPAGTRPIADMPFQLILPREHLLRDWYGTRSWLEDHGITPSLTFVTDALGNPIGGKRQSFTAFNNLGVDLGFNLEKLYGLKGGSFELSTSYRFGSSLSQKYIGNVFNVNQVLVMTVNPGFGHHCIIHTTLPKIRRVRQVIDEIMPGCDLEVDGGIDPVTAPLVVHAGANVLVAGSAIFSAKENIAAAMERIRSAVESEILTTKNAKSTKFKKHAERGVEYANRNDWSWTNGREHGAAAC